jgi:dihydroorotase
MNILLKSATIVDSESKYHLKKCDILIEKGIISKIASSIAVQKNMQVIKRPNLHISRGWFDSGVSFGEPGFEERENIENGLKTAALSGFTTIALNTNTYPAPDNKGAIRFLKTLANNHGVTLLPNGCLTQMAKGEDLAELFDMQGEEALSFYDYKKPIANPNLLKIALQYTQNFNGLVQSYPCEKAIAPKGMVNEHLSATLLGLKGIPSLAESLQVARDLYILEYTGGRLHIPTISTLESVGLIKQAKKKGLKVSCSVSINNLSLTDNVLESFDTNYKLMPPLRTAQDIKALKKGLTNGTIDMVTSDHNPIDIENKKIEFDHAKYGSIGLESCFGALQKATDLETAIQALTQQSVFNIPQNSIAQGQKANITLFDPSLQWVFKKEHIISTSKNAALLEQPLLGKAYGIINNNKLVIND